MATTLGILAAHKSPAKASIRGSAVRDLSTVDTIVRAAEDGNAAAATFARSCVEGLNESKVRMARARRLSEGSAMAAAMGYQGLARLGAEAAREELVAAQISEADVVGAVRRAREGDSFGYLSPEETRQIQREKFQEGIAVGEREQVMDKLLERLWAGSVKGQDSLGAEDFGAMDELSAACVAYGGDLESVFGDNVFQKIASTFKLTADQLRKRLEKTTERRDKFQEKLEQIEEQGKTGLQVMILRSQLKAANKRIESIKKKLEKLESTKDESDVAKEDADALGLAEQSAMVHTSSLGSDPDEALDVAIGYELEVFGVSKTTIDRLRKRVEALQKKLEEARNANREKRAENLERRIARLRARIEKLSKATEKKGKPVDVAEAAKPVQKDEDIEDEGDEGDEGADDELGLDGDDIDLMGATLDELDGQIRSLLRPYYLKLAWYVSRLQEIGKEHDRLVKAGKDTSKIDIEANELLAKAGVPDEVIHDLNELADERDDILTSRGSANVFAGHMHAGQFGAVVEDSADVSPGTVSVRSVAKLQRRLDVLKRKLEQAEEAGREPRARRLKQQIVNLRAKLQKLQDDAEAKGEDLELREGEALVEKDGISAKALTVKDPRAFTSEGYVQSFFGAECGVRYGVSEDFQPLMGYFSRRCERYGADPSEAFGESLFKKAGTFVSNLTSGRIFQSKAKKTTGLKPGYYAKQIPTSGETRILRLQPDGSLESFVRVGRGAAGLKFMGKKLDPSEVKLELAEAFFVGRTLDDLNKWLPSTTLRPKPDGFYRLRGNDRWMYELSGNTMKAYSWTGQGWTQYPKVYTNPEGAFVRVRNEGIPTSVEV